MIKVNWEGHEIIFVGTDLGLKTLYSRSPPLWFPLGQE